MIYALAILLFAFIVSFSGYLIGDFLATRRYETERKRLLKFVECVSGEVIDSIETANPDRDFGNFPRRMLKLGEEFGEASEAFLAASSSKSYKKLTYDDLREELADMVIVAVDLALTRTPDQVAAGVTAEQAKQQFMNMVAKKLIKWLTNRSKNLVMTDAE